MFKTPGKHREEGDSKEGGILYVDAEIVMLSAALKAVALQSYARKNTGLS